MARITGLISYPIKGCAGSPAYDALVTPAGLAHDRSFLVTTEDGGFRSQRRSPRLALIRPEIEPEGGWLTLHGPGVDPLRIAVDTEAPRRDIELFGTPYQGIDQGEEVAGWLSEALGEPSRLVRVPPEHHRVTGGLTPGTSGYADSAPLHLLSLPSLEQLNARLTARGSAPLPMDRFRPNIVLDGWDGEPHAEDGVRQLRAGDAEFGYAKLAIRCAVTTVDQETGTKSGPEPLRTLADYRRAAEGGVAFGVKLAVVRPGKISVGDEMAVDAWGPSEL
ncbi:MOSC domain-containing protein [Streptomyces armeniacus]|uniref:MOSC domain-containing protein n=1 Tax=Streptomyces armeniacus TaxID=83291 RepID=A0A345XTW8_9ACTN|nr:MOSC N-terminal beta barrel domain-containing protein [Streptomyces armeniacus]AXK35084.1 MOSC domain-containing protein [Streptomyces armeniacus]